MLWLTAVKVLVLIVSGTITSVRTVRIVDVTQKCQSECGISLLTQTGDVFDVHCNDTCRIFQCSLGCQHWQEAIKDDNCWDVCSKQNNSSSDNSIMHLCCVMGCRFAGGLYIQNVKDEMGIPSSPVLVADSQTNTSVRVRWEGANHSSVPLNVSYRLQWKYESLNGGWEYYRPKVPIVETIQHINGLQPYTKYRFRVAWIILPQHDPLMSSESVVISTLAWGVPSSPPVITSVTHIDTTRVSVTWEPPAFPNGPILSYVVHLSQLPHGFTLIKDIPEPNAENFFIFNNLESNTTYNIAVSCRNNVGEGPKETKNITMPVKQQVNNTSNAYLILGARQKVFKQSRDMVSKPQILYHTGNDSIRVEGVAIHVQKKILFLSDSTSAIYKVPIGRAIDLFVPPSTNVTPSNINGRIEGLSVDWLNDKLYLVEGKRIGRCAFDGSNYEVVVTGLERTPTDMKVDPFNGYLYWVLLGTPNGGLYQVDMEDLKQGNAVDPAKIHLLVPDSHLAAFTIDHQNFRLFLPNETENTIYATSLNGLEVVNIRKNTQKPQFRGVKSITFYQDLFYLMTKEEVIGEEYHRDKYYHNSFQYLSAEKPFVGLDMLHPDSQPIPVPINAVRNLQAVFKEKMAKLQWSAPRPLTGLGKGSWQKWQYEIFIEDCAANNSRELLGINDTMHSLDGLAENTEYAIKVRAYSSGGKGPWSDIFKGRTLKMATSPGFPYVLWSASEGLLKSDIIGDNIEPLIHQTNLQHSHVIDIAWYNELLFLNTNASHVYVYNTSNHKSLNLLSEVSSAVSIAVDWLGRKLYWSNPKQQMISRSNFDGSQVESLLILTIAKELNIDAFNGFIYWTTTHSVECARLNGADRRTYYQTGFFSGKQVMGLTLDISQQRVYWLVWSHNGARLYHARMASYQDRMYGRELPRNNIEEFSPLPEHTIQGPLRYYSNRLYWLQDQSEALISDIYQQNVARLPGLGLNDLKTLIVVDPSLQPCPEGFDTDSIMVIPNAINENTVRINGKWNDFNITWQPSTNVNYGKIYYEIVVDDQTVNNTLVGDHPYYLYPLAASLTPYSPLTISIRVFTYWGFSRRITKALRSPMSVPSEPLNPRVFVTYERSPLQPTVEMTVQAEFRWLPPKRPNGIILGYVVTCWNSAPDGRQNPDPIAEDILSGEERPVYIVKSLFANVSYFFQVRAYTEIGEGPSSDIVEARAGVEVPVPKLLLAKNDGVEFADIDTQEEERLPADSTHPVDIAYIWESKTIYWLDQGATLMRSNVDGTNKTKLRELSATGGSLSVDWLARHLYWSEVDQSSKSSAIWMMDLNRIDDDPKIVIQSLNEIGSIEVDPFSSKLLWTSSFRDGLGCLMSGKTDGTSIRSLFPVVQRCFYSAFSALTGEVLQFKRRPKRGEVEAENEEERADESIQGSGFGEYQRDETLFDSAYDDFDFMADQSTSCSCPRDVVVGSAMTVDTSNVTHQELLWMDLRRGNLWTSDLQGCHCRLLINGTQMTSNGFPPTSITVDKTHVYWSNTSSGRIYSILKSTLVNASEPPPSSPSISGRSQDTDAVRSDEARGIRSVVAFGSYLQPYPEMKCLIPRSYNESAQILNVSANGVTLHLKPVLQLPECGEISLASVSYVIFYSVLSNDGTSNEDVCGGCGNNCLTFNNGSTSLNSCLSLVTFNTTVIISDLRPYTNYTIRVATNNVYGSTSVSPGPRVIFRTAEGTPSKPRNVRVHVLSPEEANVTWDAPRHVYGPAVRYYIQWKGRFPVIYDGQMVSDNFQQIPEPANNISSYNVSLTGLQPGYNYSVMVRAQVMVGDAYNTSDEVFIRTYNVPNNLTLNWVNSTAISLGWKSPNDSSIIRHSLVYRLIFGNGTVTTEPQETKPDTAYVFNVTGLIPNSRYVFRIVVAYDNSVQGTTYVWPSGKGNGFYFETKGDRPSPPGSPEVVSIQRDVYKVIWKPCDGHGGKDILYVLEVQSQDDVEDPLKPSEWIQVYNGTENRWVASGLNPNSRYAFRAYAINEFGIGNFSEKSMTIVFSQIPVYGDREERHLTIVLGIIIPIILIFMCVTPYIIYRVYQKRKEAKKMLQEMALNLGVPNIALATLRELPHHHSFVHQNNALYSVGDIISDAELASLPRIGKEQIAVIKFLGSGAFGEVFEGLARNLPGENNEEAIPVAIKTLRKGATDQEKAEFLKEAQLMSNFKHEHILHLLGVCLNNDPNFIILELMEGGDLLSYLRSNRPTMFSSSMLNIQDLISICVDVARGCRYLEELHFVHRDLAARNCLVSSHDSSHRVVKIGDFGLARDIYKNDYYRKEGEGLLPVRWMSPESLVDGVFTSQSDVWAFGVLLWEVMTLGQQPYPARNNVEVLHYVRGGGRLDKPDNSPDDLHQLMLRCWSYNPYERPTFKYCLEQLQELKRKSADLPLTTVHNRNYLGRNDGVDNPAYDADEACPSSPGDKNEDGRRSLPGRNNLSLLHVTTSDGSDIDDDTNDEIRQTRRDGTRENVADDQADFPDAEEDPSEVHNYLELLQESDGYEIPLGPGDRQNDWAPPKAMDRAKTDDESDRRWSDASVPVTTTDVRGRREVTDDKSEARSDDAKCFNNTMKCGTSQPLLRSLDFSRSRGSVASAGDADLRCIAGANVGRKAISDSAPLLQITRNPHAKKQPMGMTHGFARHTSWKDSSLSLGSTDASDCSSPASPTPASGKVSRMSALSALSRLPSSSNSSSTSGIEIDCAPQTWC